MGSIPILYILVLTKALTDNILYRTLKCKYNSTCVSLLLSNLLLPDLFVEIYLFDIDEPLIYDEITDSK